MCKFLNTIGYMKLEPIRFTEEEIKELAIEAHIHIVNRITEFIELRP